MLGEAEFWCSLAVYLKRLTFQNDLFREIEDPDHSELVLQSGMLLGNSITSKPIELDECEHF